MTCAHHVIHSKTASRIERIRKLVATLQVSQLRRDEIGELLQVGPSGARRYIADLGGKLKIVRWEDPTPTYAGYPVYALAIGQDEATAYLAGLVSKPAARRPKLSSAPLEVALRDPSRHIHIMPDDVEFKPRMPRFTPFRDPLVAALFGAGRAEMRA